MVRKISSLLAEKILKRENFKRTNDIVDVGGDSVNYSLWGTNIIRYFWYNGAQVDINFHNFLTRTTISRVSEILRELSGGRYSIRTIIGIPYLIEYDDITKRTEMPTDNYYSVKL